MTTNENIIDNFKMCQAKYFLTKLKIPINKLKKENNISNLLILFKEQLMEYDIPIDELYLLKLDNNEIIDIAQNKLIIGNIMNNAIYFIIDKLTAYLMYNSDKPLIFVHMFHKFINQLYEILNVNINDHDTIKLKELFDKKIKGYAIILKQTLVMEKNVKIIKNNKKFKKQIKKLFGEEKIKNIIELLRNINYNNIEYLFLKKMEICYELIYYK